MNMQRILKLASGLVISAVLAQVSTAALADATKPDTQVVSRKVYFGDLDLSGAEGQKVLRHRIASAAWRVCDEIMPAVPGRRAMNVQCRQDVAGDAVARALAKAVAGVRAQSDVTLMAARNSR